MSDSDALPSCSEAYLAGREPAALIELMLADEDRVPRGVIDACARHGEAMVAAIEGRAERLWEERETDGAWWLRLHAVMILGLIPSVRAGLLLVRFMRRMSEAQDEDLQDWLAGYWPALFANQPAAVVPALRDLCTDRALDWYIRTNAMDPVVAAAERGGPRALDEALDWVSRIAADEEEDWEMRLSCGTTLLDFPRPRYRPLLEDLAMRQRGFGARFSGDDVERAYAVLDDAPDWRAHDDPWEFYRSEAIAARQERWAQEDAREDAKLADLREGPANPWRHEPVPTYIRPGPKIGRNDPCPCGSGRKFKKCCQPGEREESG